MADWFTFAVVSGGAGAALLGLLFVAVSIRIEAIASSAELRNRAAQTLGLFLVPVLVGLALALPGQGISSSFLGSAIRSATCMGRASMASAALR